MPRKPDERVEQAQLFQQGLKLIEIAKQLELPEGTVRRWKSTYKWNNERSGKKSERSYKKRVARLEIKSLLGTVPQRKTVTQKSMVFFGNIFRRRPFLLYKKCQMILWMFYGTRFRSPMRPLFGHNF